MNHSTIFEKYLEIVYRDVKKRFTQHDRLVHSLSETQGEILYSGIEKLFSKIKLTPQDIFVDLGSGNGRIAMQVFLCTCVKESWGIELLPELHQQAIIAKQKLFADVIDLKKSDRKLNFINGNFLELPLSMATVVLINATCFNQEMLLSLGEVINRTPNIRLVMSLRPLHALKRLRFKKAVRIACSWDSALCYTYS